MNTLSLTGAYLLKVTLVSGLLYGYYRWFLRDRRFHQFNRRFLLGIPLLSLAIPFIHLPLGASLWPAVQDLPSLAEPHPVTSGDWKETDAVTVPFHWWSSLSSWQTLSTIAYVLVACILLYLLLCQLRYIRLLTRKYTGEKMGDIHFFCTREPGTPFSFLKYIFWNDELDFNSAPGRQILRHELTHVRQKHSIDLLLLRSLIAFYWINPFFHLIYREIRAVHEFLADSDAIAEGDRSQYAELLVWQTVRNPPTSLLHPFFQSPIKRRITMITQLKTTRTPLLSRLMILPLLLLLFCAFAARHHSYPNVRIHTGENPLTVVIDAGHGGIDPGAVSKNGTQEKNINLAIAEKIKQLSGEYNVRVLMTRESDQLAGGKSTVRESLIYRAEMANQSKADLFIAIHTDMLATKDVKGFSVFVARGNAHYSQCVQVGSILTETLKNSYPTETALKQRKEGLYVLDKADMPAVLLLCGNMSNEKDLSFISKEGNQEKVARDILQGIRKYAAAKGN